VPVALRTQSKAHPLADRGLDLYETSPVAVHALMRVEQLPLRIWEPACGRGAIARELEAAGHVVVSTDIATGTNFLTCNQAAESLGVVTNPPFQRAAEFARHAIGLVPYVALLLRWAFWEGGTGRREAHRARAHVLDVEPPARAYCFANRLPMMHRHGWTGPRASSSMAFGWFIWDRSHVGPRTIVRRLHWTLQGELELDEEDQAKEQHP
jgi:hypothetical protein